MFDLDRFIVDCEAAVVGRDDHTEAREVLARAVRDPAAVLATLGEPKRAGIEVLHRGFRVTILNLVWGPQMSFMPHNHHMWAVIGLYTGREDNIFWRRLPEPAQGWKPPAHARSDRAKPARSAPTSSTPCSTRCRG